MKKEIIELLIQEGCTIKEISDKTGKAPTTVRHWMKKYKLKTRNYRKRKKPHLCSKCGESEPKNFYGHQKSSCKLCSHKDSLKRFQDYRQEAVNYKGGKCSICEYDKYVGALNFHHLDPKAKDPNYSAMKNWSFERKKSELDKCILVCSNCHAEIHAGITTAGR